MRRIIITLFVVTLLFTACNVKEKTNKDVLVNNITKYEKALIDTVNYNLNTDTAKILINKYLDFTKTYTKDSLTPIYLLKAADICISIKDYQQAVKLYENVYTNYSTFKKAPEALFLQAMTYCDFLKNESLGKIKYQEFIEKYPNHTLTDDAKKSIEFIGKSPEEILEIIQSKDSLSNN
jgi:outer membrane protein assembly factor BamD (BamD/ComL family)